MLVDLSCPAEIFGVSLPTEESPFSELTLFNLSDRVIASVEASLRLFSADGREREKVVYRARALNGRPHSVFMMRIPCNPTPGVERAEAVPEKVWYADNDVWRRKPENAVEYTPNALPVSQALTALKYAAGETAVGFPSLQKGLWVCVCGRPNPAEAEVCARCRRGREEVFFRFNREAVEQQLSQQERRLELQSRSALEDTARLQREREQAYEAQRRRRGSRIRLAIALVMALGFTALAIFAGAPAARLWSASRALDAGKPEEARETLTALGTFPGAEGLLKEAEYRIAARDAEEAKDPETLARAAEALRADGREGAEALAEKADFSRARLLMAAGDYAGAAEAVAALPEGTEGLAEFQLEQRYAQALRDLEGRYYVLARDAFLSLGHYRDAAALADACVYRPAVEMMENGDYDGAILQFSRIPGYEDSEAQIRKCRYLKGQQLEEEGDRAAAAEAYFEAGDTEDAAIRAQALAEALGDEAFEKADYLTALAWYQRLPEDTESLNRTRNAIYTLAKRALADQENRQALEWLGQLPADYEDVKDMKVRATLALAEKAEKAENWEEMISLLAPWEAEQDCRKPLDRARIALAKQRIGEGELFAAQELLSAVEQGNREAEQLMKQLVVNDEEE